MKGGPKQQHTPKSLKKDIFETFRNKSLHQFTHFLQRSRERQSRYFPFSSQHTLIKSQVDSPNTKTNLSSNRINHSPPLRTRSHLYQNYVSKPTIQQLQRSKKKMKNEQAKSRKKSARKVESKNQNKPSSRKVIIYKNKIKKTEKSQSKDKKRQHSKQYRSTEKHSSSKSRSKSSKNKQHKTSKLNLSSIIEQYSSEEKIITPSSKITKRKQSKKHQSSIDKTYKKQYQQTLSEPIKKKIDRFLRSPEKFITLKKLNCLSIKMKIQRRKIIEIQINILSHVEQLKIFLEKGNLECQHIEEQYSKLHVNQKINLLSCVRQINLDQPFKLPKMILSYLEGGEQTDYIQKIVTLPYTWLHLTTQIPKHTKSRVKTKACIQSISITPSNLKPLSLILPHWITSHTKSQNIYHSYFGLGQCQFELELTQKRNSWSIQISGRRQQRLYKLLCFLYQLLC